MQEQKISFQTAKLAFEKGATLKDYFGNIDYYGENRGEHYKSTSHFNLETGYPRITQSLLAKWLREVHSIDVESRAVRFVGDKQSSYYQPYINGSIIDMQKYATYEEALEVGLFKALQTLNTK